MALNKNVIKFSSVRRLKTLRGKQNGGVKLSFNFGFNLKEAYVKVLPKDKVHLLHDNTSDEAHEIKITEGDKQDFELFSITNDEAFIPYDDFLYRIHLPKSGEFCFPTNNHGVTPIGKTPWADTFKTSSKNAYIDNIRISNTYHNNFTFPYEKTIFYRGVDNMVSTLCDIHNISKTEVFTFVLINHKKRLLLLRERVLYDKKNHLNTFDLFRFNTNKLKSNCYFLGYFLSGKMFYMKKVQFEDFTYDFRKKII